MRKSKKKLTDYYKISDGRAPDTTKALFEDNPEYKLKKKELDENYFKNLEKLKKDLSDSRKRKSPDDDPKTAEVNFDEVAEKEEVQCFGDMVRDEPDLIYDESLPKEFIIKCNPLSDDFALDELPGIFNVEAEKERRRKNNEDKEEEYEEPDASEVQVSQSPEATINEKSNAIAMLSKQLNPNKDNSCFIDAPCEMLIRCIIPFIIDEIPDNSVLESEADRILMASFFELVEKLNPKMSSEYIRNYVWENYSARGLQEDTHRMFTWLTEDLKYIKSRLAFDNVKRKTRCRKCFDRSEKPKILDVAPFVPGLPTIKDLIDAGDSVPALQKLKVSFEQAYLKHLTKPNDAQVCLKCMEKAVDAENVIPDDGFPNVLFISDITNFSPASERQQNCQPYFPEHFTIGNNEYHLHAKVFSTEASGGHFYAVGKILLNVESYKVAIFNIDNLNQKHECIRLSEEVDVFEKTNSPHLLQYENTVFVCYLRSG